MDGDIDNGKKEDRVRAEKRGNIDRENYITLLQLHYNYNYNYITKRKKSETIGNDGDREKGKRLWIQRGRRYKGQRKGNRQGEQGNLEIKEREGKGREKGDREKEGRREIQ